jgi:cysteine desulfurase / selenocysteine lyase
MLDLNIRDQFPVLKHIEKGNLLVYLDNTATTHKPLRVIERMSKFYTHQNATIHRGVYGLSQEATDYCEDARKKAKTFINAKKEEEIIFVKGTTEAINLIAESYGKTNLKKGDEILITEMEHHANIVPWQQLCTAIGCTLKVAPIDDNGELILDAWKAGITEDTKIVSLTHVSNVLGTTNPVQEMCDYAKAAGAIVVIDGAQAISHIKVDVQKLNCDFYAFSGHKMHGPTGIGVMYGKYDVLKEMPPYQTGGDMIDVVTFEKTTFAAPPARFEPGTPAIANIIGLGETFDFLTDVGIDNIFHHEHKLLNYAHIKLKEIKGLRIIGEAKEKNAIVSFVLDDIHPHDAGTILDTEGIAVRVGHHCAQPLMKRLEVPATIRASFSIYNTLEEIDALVAGIKKIQDIML